jgi:hypothetical protein
VRALAAEDLLDQVDLGVPERALDRGPDQPPDVLVGDHEGVLAKVADMLADGSHDPAALDVLARSDQRLRRQLGHACLLLGLLGEANLRPS